MDLEVRWFDMDISPSPQRNIMKLEDNKNWLAVKSAKTRAYRFTHHDYTDEIEARIQALVPDPDDGSLLFLVYGKETCPTTGRPHLQGFFYFKSKRSGAELIKQLPGTILFTCDASAMANSKYCQKENTAFLYGKCPMNQEQKGQTQKDTWEEVALLADKGDFDAIANQHHKMDILHYKALFQRYVRRRSKDIPKCLDGELEGVWILGPPGSGKSQHVYDNYPDAFPKPGDTEWWDFYNYEDTVWIDDFDPTVKGMSYLLKTWTDRYRCIVETKHGTMMIRPKKFIVTSNYTIKECFPRDRKLRKAMERRFPTIMQIGEWDSDSESEEEVDVPAPKKKRKVV